MKKKQDVLLNETVELLKKVADSPDSVTDKEKKRLKKLIKNKDLLIEAMQNMGEEYDNIPPYLFFPPAKNDKRTDEQIIADNYITLSKFVIEKMQLKNVTKLKVEEEDGCPIIYALTPDPVEVDFARYVTSDYPSYKELLLEAEALEGDLFMDDNTGKFRLEINKRIEDANL